MGRLDRKIAAVTGGASGIGEAAVRCFVAEGASVAFCDLDGERGQRVAAELEAAGAKVAFTQADVGAEAACHGFVNGAEEKFGRLDMLINNAGIRRYENIDGASVASWNEILRSPGHEAHNAFHSNRSRPAIPIDAGRVASVRGRHSLFMVRAVGSSRDPFPMQPGLSVRPHIPVVDRQWAVRGDLMRLCR